MLSQENNEAWYEIDRGIGESKFPKAGQADRSLEHDTLPGTLPTRPAICIQPYSDTRT